MNRTPPRLQKRDSTEGFEPKILSRQIEQSDRLKDSYNQAKMRQFSPKAQQKPKLQGAENLFPRRTDFFRKAHKIYFQGEQNFQSPFFGPKSGVFQDHLLKKKEINFSMLRKTKMDSGPEKRQF
ncbi:MAG: hypothetical protein NC252_10950, partial [Roseburia sp.]|nr:hypothetical protein [Roseburia sp.]MCM1420714.1 hypothetical protein [Bacteroides sp.]